jgi:hypothetical protein
MSIIHGNIIFPQPITQAKLDIVGISAKIWLDKNCEAIFFHMIGNGETIQWQNGVFSRLIFEIEKETGL